MARSPIDEFSSKIEQGKLKKSGGCPSFFQVWVLFLLVLSGGAAVPSPSPWRCFSLSSFLFRTVLVHPSASPFFGWCCVLFLLLKYGAVFLFLLLGGLCCFLRLLSVVLFLPFFFGWVLVSHLLLWRVLLSPFLPGVVLPSLASYLVVVLFFPFSPI